MFQKEARQGIGAEEKNSNTEWESAGRGGADNWANLLPPRGYGAGQQQGELVRRTLLPMSRPPPSLLQPGKANSACLSHGWS